MHVVLPSGLLPLIMQACKRGWVDENEGKDAPFGSRNVRGVAAAIQSESHCSRGWRLPIILLLVGSSHATSTMCRRGALVCLNGMRSMSVEDRQAYTTGAKILPYVVDASHVSLCRRPRLYWFDWAIPARGDCEVHPPKWAPKIATAPD